MPASGICMERMMVLSVPAMSMRAEYQPRPTGVPQTR